MFSIAQFFALVAVASAAYIARQDAPVCDRSYVVQPGDTCDGISAAQNASTYQVATANAGIINADCSNLFPGENICLGFVGEDCTTVHVVASGDGCDTISAAAGISTSTLLANNPNVDSGCTNIYPGEVLCTAPST